MFFDKETLTVNESDILWRWYKKRFEIERKEIDPPKNLCSYFWTSVHGFFLWIDREVPLTRLWIVALGALLLFIVSAPMTQAAPIIASVVAVIAFLVLLPSALVSANTSINRLFRWLDTKPKGRVVGTCAIFGVLFGWLAIEGELGKLLSEVLAMLPYAVGLVVTVLLIGVICIALPQKITGGVGKAARTFVAVLSATKQKFCPRVEPPASFQKSKKD